jgi:long-chain acyl-CoA synthetase
VADYPWIKSYPPGVTWELDVPRKTLHQSFDESCAQYADLPMTDFLDKVMTYKDYKEATDRAAAGFQKLGVKPGVHVGLYLPNTPHYLIAFFGVLKAGGCIVNYSPLDADRELDFKIGDSETDILITLDVAALYPKIARMKGKTRLKKLIVGSIADYLRWPKNWLYPIARKKELSVWPRDDWHMSFRDLLANDGKYQPHPVGDNLWDEVALLQYTGGTTGLPKAAMLTHGCVMAATSQGQAWTAAYTKPGEEKVVCVLPLFHIYALSSVMLGAVRSGNQLILYPRPDIDLIVKDLAGKKPTFLPGVPTLYTAIMKNPKAKDLDLRSLKICLSGGAPLPAAPRPRPGRSRGGRRAGRRVGPMRRARSSSPTRPVLAHNRRSPRRRHGLLRDGSAPAGRPPPRRRRRRSPRRRSRRARSGPRRRARSRRAPRPRRRTGRCRGRPAADRGPLVGRVGRSARRASRRPRRRETAPRSGRG